MPDLLLHSGGREVSERELVAIPTPASTPSWTPIPHLELLGAVQREIRASGLVIARQRLALSRSALGAEGDRFFGLLEISRASQTHEVSESSSAGYALTIGLRNAHDQRYPAGLCVGSRVLVCDNLAFFAEVVLTRKHTRFIRRDLPGLITRAVGRLGSLGEHQARRIEAYQNTPLAEAQLHDLAIRALDAGVLAASKLPRLLAQYREPGHPEFAPRTLWSAFNAFTEVLKAYDLQDLPRRTQALHGLCDLLCHLSS
jgi:hypothetical protein